MKHRKQNVVRRRFRGFTIPELLVVIGVIALLIAVLVPALFGAKRTADMTVSQSNMRQIGIMLRSYSSDNRDFIVPSQFNYTDPANANNPANNYPIKVRSNTAPPVGSIYKGTWTDILWTENGMGANGKAAALNTEQGGWNATTYEYDSPDKFLYEAKSDYDSSPFRSTAPNSRDFVGAVAGVATPFGGPAGNPGDGATEAGLPGYFAANNFFNADRDAPPDANGAPPAIGRWYTNSQIKSPDRSMYLIDSLAGETIEPKLAPFSSADGNGDGTPDTLEVDFRYNGACLILFLDGHTRPESPWIDLPDLKNRKVKVDRLDLN